MFELAEKDKKHYENFKDSITELYGQKDNLQDNLKPLIESIHTTIILPLQNLAELEERLAHVDGYLLMQDFLEKNPNNSIIQATQKVRDQSALIKESLQDIKDIDLSTLDDLGSPCTDEKFFELIPCEKTKALTKKLLAGHSLNLPSTDIIELTDAWGIAVSGIIKDAQNQALPLKPGTLDTIVRFFCIHEELEDLYDKVSNLVA